LNFKEYQEGVLRTANQNGTLEENKMNAALGLGEAGEVQNIIKKELFHGHPEDRMAILDELGDMLYYIAWTADLYLIDLELVAQYNHDKLKARYPEGFDKEKSLHRAS
jgi:NTP pyrophosphatase (non-canonical NTP hydrolase)